MKRVLWIAWLALSLSVNAQPAKTTIVFDKTEHDFGTIKESEGPKTVVFNFRNTGKRPMYLKNVVTSCGCTTPNWTKDTVAPGKTASITATFDPANRAGAFDKLITVLAAQTDPEFHALIIKGTVEAREVGPAEKYPVKQGNVRFESDHISFGSVVNTTADTALLTLYNDGFSTINIKEVQGQNSISFQAKSTEIRPKSAGQIRMIFDGRKANDLGVVFAGITLVTDDKDQPNKQLYFSATVQDYFPPMDKKDSLSAPRAKFDKTHHNWGTLKQGEIMTVDFIITNTGKRELEIKKTKASCGCTASQPEKYKLRKGESTRIKVQFNSTGRSGHEKKSIAVMTNDPFDPVINLTIAGEVDTSSK